MMERAGGREAIHREQRWGKCLHSTFRYTTQQGGEMVAVWFSYFNCVVREQTVCTSFASDSLCVCDCSKCMNVFRAFPARPIPYLHFVRMLVCKPERMHTFQRMYLCLFYTESCILIRSQRPFRGSNPQVVIFRH